MHMCASIPFSTLWVSIMVCCYHLVVLKSNESERSFVLICIWSGKEWDPITRWYQGCRVYLQMHNNAKCERSCLELSTVIPSGLRNNLLAYFSSFNIEITLISLMFLIFFHFSHPFYHLPIYFTPPDNSSCLYHLLPLLNPVSLSPPPTISLLQSLFPAHIDLFFLWE